MSKTGEQIKKRRKQLGMSADELAEKLGVSRSTIFRYEKGDIDKVPAEYAKPLADALCTTPAYLMGWEDNLEGGPWSHPEPCRLPHRFYPQTYD